MEENIKIISAKGGWVRSGVKLSGKTVVITGANTGIGFETALDLAKRDARIIMACRDMQRGEDARKRIIVESKSDKVITKKLDLMSLESVQEFANDIIATESRIDILINNAGVMMCPQLKTNNGFEKHFGVNHLGHFFLTNLLLNLIKKSGPSRIVIVSSMIQKSPMKIHWRDINMEGNYVAWTAYGQSKLANVMFAKELNKRLKGSDTTVYCVHPGLVNTELARYWYDTAGFLTKFAIKFICPLVFKSPKRGAQTSIFCAVAPEIVPLSGCYFAECKSDEKNVNPLAHDDEQNERLWNLSAKMVNLK